MKPKFQRPNLHSKKRVKANWRKPRGIDSKQRQKLKAYGAIPDIGYRTPKTERGLHPNGLTDTLVANPAQLAVLDPQKHCIRFVASLGKRKKTQLKKLASEKKFKMVN